MPEIGKGRSKYAIATRTIPHGAPCVTDKGYVGVAIKQKAYPAGTGLGNALVTVVQVGETFLVDTKGEVVVTNPGGLVEGDAVYIADDGDLWPAAGVNEVQRVTLTGATGGNFTLTYAGQTTAAIAFDASNAAVQAALIALSNLAPGDVVVTGSAGGPYTVTFGGTLADTDVAAMTADGTGLTGTSPTVAVTTLTGGQEAARKFGRVSEIAPARGLATGKMRVNLDAKDSF